MDDAQNPTQNPGTPTEAPIGTPDTGAPMGGEQTPEAPTSEPTAPEGGEMPSTPADSGVTTPEAPAGDVNQGGTV